MDSNGKITRREWIGQIKRRILVLAVALALIGIPLAGSTSMVEEASAQGTARVEFCVKLPGGTVAANFNVTLYAWNGSYFAPYRGGTSGNGCATFYQVPVGNSYYLWAQSPSGIWWGYSSTFYLPGPVSVVVRVHQ